MASFFNQAGAISTTNANPATQSITATTVTNSILVISIRPNSGARLPASATYGGVSGTILSTGASGTTTTLVGALIMFINPPTGTQTLSITPTGGAEQYVGSYAFYGNVKSTGQPTQSNYLTASNVQPNVQTITASPAGIVVTAAISADGITLNSGATSRNNNSGVIIADSNGDVGVQQSVSVSCGTRYHAVWQIALAPIPLNELPVTAHYKLDETSGNAIDSSGNGYTLTNNGSTPYTTGKLNNCIDFGTTNTSKYLSIDSTLGMLGSTEKSYSFWAKINTAPASTVNQVLFRHLYGGSAVGNYANVSYYNNAGTYQVRMPTSPAGMTVNQTLTVGTWYHFVVTVPANNTGNISCYMNGSLLGTTPNWAQNYALTTRLVLGADHAFSDKAPASIDEFSVFPFALTADEVSQLFNSGRANAYPFTASPSLYGCVLGYKMDESSGNAIDVIGVNTGVHTSVTQTTGKINNGASYSGGTSFTQMTSKLGTFWDNNYTVAMFVKPTTLDTTNGDLLIWPGDRNQQHQIRATGKLGITCFNGAAADVIGNTSLVNGTWYHTIFERTGATTGKVYLNGADDTSGTAVMQSPANTLTQGFRLASREDFTGANFNGMIDEVYLFNRILSPSEKAILTAGNAQSQYPWTASAPTLGYYPMINLLGQGQIW